MGTKRKCMLLMIMSICIVLQCSYSIVEIIQNNVAERNDESADIEVQEAKGYNLVVDDSERDSAEEDCMKVLELISDIYKNADKGDASNLVLSEGMLHQMSDAMKETGYAVRTDETYSNMENYEEFDVFLLSALAGEPGSAVIYMVHSGGGIWREKYIYDGKDMYLLSAEASWREDGVPVITYISYTRLKEWRYSDKGWFCYKLCVPEPPEVTEIIDGSRLVRVRPMSEENRVFSEKCVLGLGYQGNNLLCSDWDIDRMENLDYNGLYEYLYAMKYREKFKPEDYPDGIPKEKFESLIMEYLPVSAEELQKYAVYDAENQSYAWARLGCFNYSPTVFGTSVPEVTDIRDYEDGTITLTVDAVCEMLLCDDAVITHELTVRMEQDGSFQYLSNKVLNDGIQYIPEYQYRLGNI